MGEQMEGMCTEVRRRVRRTYKDEAEIKAALTELGSDLAHRDIDPSPVQVYIADDLAISPHIGPDERIRALYAGYQATFLKLHPPSV